MFQYLTYLFVHLYFMQRKAIINSVHTEPGVHYPDRTENCKNVDIHGMKVLERSYENA